MREQADVKTHKWHIFSRIYCPVIIIAWSAFVYWEFRPGGSRSASSLFFMLLLALPALFMLASLIAFPWRYSVFGRYRRTLSPHGQPLLIGRFAGIRIGWLQTPFTIQLYESGVGLSIWGIGKAFIPLEYITQVEKGLLWRCSLHHCWPEVRTPIKFSSQKIYKELVESPGADRTIQ